MGEEWGACDIGGRVGGHVILGEEWGGGGGHVILGEEWGACDLGGRVRGMWCQWKSEGCGVLWEG